MSIDMWMVERNPDKYSLRLMKRFRDTIKKLFLSRGGLITC